MASSSDISNLVTTAVRLQKKKPQISYVLFKLAQTYRPKGPTILKGIEYLSKQLPKEQLNELQVNNINSQLIDVCKQLQNYPTYLTKVVPIAIEILSSEELELIDEIIDQYDFYKSISKDVGHLNRQLTSTRSRLMSVHSALIYSNAFEMHEIDDYAAKASPIEIVNKKSETTLIVFGGMAMKPSMPIKEFYKSLASQDVNLIFLKDFYQCWYQRGIMGITHDIKSTAKYLQAVLPTETTNIICLGTSSGGYAAIQIGAIIGANKIVALSPQTNINNSIFKRFKSFDTVVSQDYFSKQEFDLREVLDSSDFTGSIKIYYGENHKVDSLAAQNLSHHAELISLPTDSHRTGQYLKEHGMLDGFISEVLS